MNNLENKSRVLLLVEDNPGDAEWVTELLDQANEQNLRIVHVPMLKAAINALAQTEVDVVVLDLRLPDSNGVESVKAVRRVARQVPIVVLTGSDDDALAHECLDAGAQDYLSKSEVRAQSLRRAIGYAITRVREAQLRELQEELNGYRQLSSATQATSVTAALAGSGAISLRSPGYFGDVVDSYYDLLVPFLERQSEQIVASRAQLELIVTALGDAGGGPRDLLDVHLAALDRAVAAQDDSHSRSVVFEARLLALEMMGLLVDYYRVGHRRLFFERASS